LAGGGVSAVYGGIRPHQPRPSDCRLSALAGDVRADDSRAVRLYRYGPCRRLAKWRWISNGSVLAALAWLAVSSLFSWYLGKFANYNATYGALGAVVGLMMWMWLSTIVVLVGAELNSEIEH
ncbi:MAG: YihY/virulence factor BrkB family protein, partial [Isosphaeraceae bacterium]